MPSPRAVREALSRTRQYIECADVETLCYIFASNLVDLTDDVGLFDGRVLCLMNADKLFTRRGNVYCVSKG